MDSDTATESNHSLRSRSFLNRVNDRLRKMLDRSSEDALQDIDKHSLQWWLFVSSTLEASVFMGKNYSDNLLSIKNTGENLTLKQMFDTSEQLMLEQSDEIYGVKTINWEDSSWKYLSLVGDEQVISLLHTKVYVFSDSVLCIRTQMSKTAWERQLDWSKDSLQYRMLDTIDGEPMEFEWMCWIAHCARSAGDLARQAVLCFWRPLYGMSLSQMSHLAVRRSCIVGAWLASSATGSRCTSTRCLTSSLRLVFFRMPIISYLPLLIHPAVSLLPRIFLLLVPCFFPPSDHHRFPSPAVFHECVLHPLCCRVFLVAAVRRIHFLNTFPVWLPQRRGYLLCFRFRVVHPCEEHLFLKPFIRQPGNVPDPSQLSPVNFDPNRIHP